MQDILLEKLPHTMKVLRSCQCERCRLEILAIAMNSLPTAYAVTTEEEDSLERVKKLRRDYEVKVTATLIKAIQQVKNEPRH
jgi:competence protein ComFB